MAMSNVDPGSVTTNCFGSGVEQNDTPFQIQRFFLCRIVGRNKGASSMTVNKLPLGGINECCLIEKITSPGLALALK